MWAPHGDRQLWHRGVNGLGGGRTSAGMSSLQTPAEQAAGILVVFTDRVVRLQNAVAPLWPSP